MARRNPPAPCHARPTTISSYSLTWFGLAATLAVTYALFVRKALRRMNAAADTAYARLQDRFARIATLHEASAMLGWDAAAMMPPGGAAARGDQLAVLAGLAHGQLTAPSVADDLDEAGSSPDAEAPSEPWRAANLRLMRHAYTRATAVPSDLVEATPRANSACESGVARGAANLRLHAGGTAADRGGALGAAVRRGDGPGARAVATTMP